MPICEGTQEYDNVLSISRDEMQEKSDNTNTSKLHDGCRKHPQAMWSSKGFQDRMKRLQKSRSMSASSLKTTLGGRLKSPIDIRQKIEQRKSTYVLPQAGGDADRNHRFQRNIISKTDWYVQAVHKCDRKSPRMGYLSKTSEGAFTREPDNILLGSRSTLEEQNPVALKKDDKHELLFERRQYFDNGSSDKGNLCTSEVAGKNTCLANSSTPSPVNDNIVKIQTRADQSRVDALKNHRYLNKHNVSIIEGYSFSDPASFEENNDKRFVSTELAYSNLVRTMLLNDVDSQLCIDMECYERPLTSNLKPSLHRIECELDEDSNADLGMGYVVEKHSTSGSFKNMNWVEISLGQVDIDNNDTEGMALNHELITLSKYYGIDKVQSSQSNYNDMTHRNGQNLKQADKKLQQLMTVNSSIRNINTVSNSNDGMKVIDAESSNNTGVDVSLMTRYYCDDSTQARESYLNDHDMESQLPTGSEKTNTNELDSEISPCDITPALSKNTLLTRFNCDNKSKDFFSQSLTNLHDNSNAIFQGSERDTICSIENEDPKNEFTKCEKNHLFDGMNTDINIQKTKADAYYLSDETSMTPGYLHRWRGDRDGNDTIQKPMSYSIHEEALERQSGANTEETNIKPLTCPEENGTSKTIHQAGFTIANQHLTSGVDCIAVKSDTIASDGFDLESNGSMNQLCFQAIDSDRRKEDISVILATTAKEKERFRQEKSMTIKPILGLESILTFKSAYIENISGATSPANMIGQENKAFDEADSDGTFSRVSIRISPSLNVEQNDPSDPKINLSALSCHGSSILISYSTSLSTQKASSLAVSRSVSAVSQDKKEIPSSRHVGIFSSNSDKSLSSDISKAPCPQPSPRDLSMSFHDLNTAEDTTQSISNEQEDAMYQNANQEKTDYDVRNNKNDYGTQENEVNFDTQGEKIKYRMPDYKIDDFMQKGEINYGTQEDNMNYSHIQKRVHEYTKQAFVKRFNLLRETAPNILKQDAKTKDRQITYSKTGRIYKEKQHKNRTKGKSNESPLPKDTCFVTGAQVPVLSRPIADIKKYKPNVKIKLKSSNKEQNINNITSSLQGAGDDKKKTKRKYTSNIQAADETKCKESEEKSHHTTVSGLKHNPQCKIKEQTSKARKERKDIIYPKIHIQNKDIAKERKQSLFENKRYDAQNFKCKLGDTLVFEDSSTGNKADIKRSLPSPGAKIPEIKTHAVQENLIKADTERRRAQNRPKEYQKVNLSNMTSEVYEISSSKGSVSHATSASSSFDQSQNQELELANSHKVQQSNLYLENDANPGTVPSEKNGKLQYQKSRPVPTHNGKPASHDNLFDLFQTHELWQHKRRSNTRPVSQNKDSKVETYNSLISDAINNARAQAEKYRGAWNIESKSENDCGKSSKAMTDRSKELRNSSKHLILPSITSTKKGNFVSREELNEENNMNNSCIDIDSNGMNIEKPHIERRNSKLPQFSFKQDDLKTCMDYLDFSRNFNNNSKVHSWINSGDRKSKIPVLIRKVSIKRSLKPDKNDFINDKIHDTSILDSNYLPVIVKNNVRQVHSFTDTQYSGRKESPVTKKENVQCCIHNHLKLLSKCELFCCSVSDISKEQCILQRPSCSINGTCSYYSFQEQKDCWEKCERNEETETNSNYEEEDQIEYPEVLKEEACHSVSFERTGRRSINPEIRQSFNSNTNWLQIQSPAYSHHTTTSSITDSIPSVDDRMPDQTLLEIIHKKVAKMHKSRQNSTDSSQFSCKTKGNDIVESPIDSMSSKVAFQNSVVLGAESDETMKTANHENTKQRLFIFDNLSDTHHFKSGKQLSPPSKHPSRPVTSEPLDRKIGRKIPLLLSCNTPVLCWPQPIKSKLSPLVSKRPRPRGLLGQGIVISSIECTEQRWPFVFNSVNNEDSQCQSIENKEMCCVDQPEDEEDVQREICSRQRFAEDEKCITNSRENYSLEKTLVRNWNVSKRCAYDYRSKNKQVRFKKGSLNFCFEPPLRVPLDDTCSDSHTTNSPINNIIFPEIKTEHDASLSCVKTFMSEWASDEEFECGTCCSQRSGHSSENEMEKHSHLEFRVDSVNKMVIENYFESSESELDNTSSGKHSKRSLINKKDNLIKGNKSPQYREKKSISFTLPPLSRRQTGRPHKERWKRYY